MTMNLDAELWSVCLSTESYIFDTVTLRMASLTSRDTAANVNRNYSDSLVGLVLMILHPWPIDVLFGSFADSR